MTGRDPRSVVASTEGLAKRFGTRTVLQSLDLEVRAGEVLGYLGPNGAGKTTTLRLLMGLLRPTAGRATILGADAWSESATTHRWTGYLAGEPALPDRLTGRQQVRFAARLRDQSDAARADAIAGRLDLDLDRPVRELSKGNRQKLAVVLAFMSSPALLLLDEPTSGFDPLVQHEFHALLREHAAAGAAVILSSHVLGEVQQVVDRIAVLRAGRLIAMEEMQSLRDRSLHRVHARFAEDIAAEDFMAVSGLRNLVVDGNRLACSTPASSLDELCRAMVRRHRLVDLECTEADLEETFLTYYGTGGQDAA